MRHFKRFVHAMLRAGLFAAYVWSATDEERALIESLGVEEDEDEDDGDDEVLERDAAYLTTGLITASRAVATAHDTGKDCRKHHEAAIVLLSSIEDSTTAIRIIQHLLGIVAESVDEEDIQRMVTSIIHTELGEDDPHPH